MPQIAQVRFTETWLTRVLVVCWRGDLDFPGVDHKGQSLGNRQLANKVHILIAFSTSGGVIEMGDDDAGFVRGEFEDPMEQCYAISTTADRHQHRGIMPHRFRPVTADGFGQ